MLRLELLQLLEAPVVLGVADLGRVLVVVEARVAAQLLGEGADAGRCLALRAGLDSHRLPRVGEEGQG